MILPEFEVRVNLSFDVKMPELVIVAFKLRVVADSIMPLFRTSAVAAIVT